MGEYFELIGRSYQQIVARGELTMLIFSCGGVYSDAGVGAIGVVDLAFFH